jgi:prostaglandin-H2 D-isomerase / glutathione transferase
MPKLKLTYFDFDGGRGEPARLALRIGGVAFEDHRVAMADWPKLRETTPLGALPVLEVDGRTITQSNTINRYVGKLAGLYPKDEWQAALCDEILDATEDIGSRVGATIGLGDAEKKKAREALVADALPRHLAMMEGKLKAAGGEYFADQRLTVADLKVYELVRWLRTGVLDHIPKDLVDRVAPSLVQHSKRIAAIPKIADYYQGRKKAA